MTLFVVLSNTFILLGSTTKPFIFKATVGVSALDVTVIVFLIGFTLFVSYFTSIFPVAPGKIGPLGFLGTVQPQVDFTLDIISGALPVFVNSNTRTPSDPLSI